ncbi:hypothetical protein CAPN008_00250 [Capnocytophaga canis]|uniref:hypothetical protein n=1 Tax=Capnocytophaga canis TaxID=1848903 RepID=UPI001AD2DE3B|nr:hypothetical protein [Capnocytophaga canis]GIM59975.1 hypothetical protein CAPN008_00250 [Capnocytophaga canis]
MRKLSGKNAKSLAKAMIYALLPYKDFVKPITSDNEFEIRSIREHLKKTADNFLKISILVRN